MGLRVRVFTSHHGVRIPMNTIKNKEALVDYSRMHPGPQEGTSHRHTGCHTKCHTCSGRFIPILVSPFYGYGRYP